MDQLEVVVEGELFRITERTQPGGGKSYDFAWLNGPAEGTYGFTIGRTAGCAAPEELLAQARHFVQGFYALGGIGATDFPTHKPANAERDDKQ